MNPSHNILIEVFILVQVFIYINSGILKMMAQYNKALITSVEILSFDFINAMCSIRGNMITVLPVVKV